METADVKTRVTRNRSSLGSNGTGPTEEDQMNAERPKSPGRQTRSRTGTPTIDENASADSLPVTVTGMKRKSTPATNNATPTRRLRSNKLNTDEETDTFCWICRKDGPVISCQLCPRVYHTKCLGMTSSPSEQDWICVECEKVMRSESEDTCPQTLRNLGMEKLMTALEFALIRMKVPNSEVFQIPVDPAMEPEYHNIVKHPMDMSLLEKNIKRKMYGSTEAFLADAKWILHNSIIYNGMHNKYTMAAKSVIKTARNQMMEIEACPDCYLTSCTQEENWFAKPCKIAHALVWAKLKGYPFWPAKALREVDGQVDCRFFGAHDKAWVASSQCFMLSEEPPAVIKNKKGSGFDEAMAELDLFIRNFRLKHGAFQYAPMKEPYQPDYGQPSDMDIPSVSPVADRTFTDTSGARSTSSVTSVTTTPTVTNSSAVVPGKPEKEDKIDSYDAKVKSEPKEDKTANAEVGFPPRPAEELPPPPETDPLIRAIEEKMNAIEESFDEEVTSNNAPEKSETIPDSKPQPERESIPVSHMNGSANSDRLYREKLAHTIETCAEKLGKTVTGDEEEDSESDESDSDTESSPDASMETDDQPSTKRKRSASFSQSKRRRSEPNTAEQRITQQLLELMTAGLKGTITEAVKEALKDPTSVTKPASTNHSPEKKPVETENRIETATEKPELAEKAEEVGDEPLVKEQVEKLRWKHKCEIDAIKHNSELAAMEMRKSIELEKERALWRLRKQLEHKFKKIVEETKKKQWCAMCGKEAIFYCCWNTSYCDYPCQQKHWPSHLKSCAQISKDDNDKKNGQSPPDERSSGAPPPYISSAAASTETTLPSSQSQPVSQYQILPGQTVQYMPVPSNSAHIYQAQLPVQAVPMQAGPRGQSPMLYPVMQPPPPPGAPPQPQSYMLSQRQPYRLAPKYAN